MTITNKTNTKEIIKFLVYAGVIGLLLFIFIFFTTGAWIGYSVKEKCQVAQEDYEGDCVEALTKMVADESRSPGMRTDAVWALGQLGDERALPVLEQYYDGGPCDHQERICQYELRKAINLINSHLNIAAFVWR